MEWYDVKLLLEIKKARCLVTPCAKVSLWIQRQSFNVKLYPFESHVNDFFTPRVRPAGVAFLNGKEVGSEGVTVLANGKLYVARNLVDSIKYYR